MLLSVAYMWLTVKSVVRISCLVQPDVDQNKNMLVFTSGEQGKRD